MRTFQRRDGTNLDYQQEKDQSIPGDQRTIKQILPFYPRLTRCMPCTVSMQARTDQQCHCSKVDHQEEKRQAAAGCQGSAKGTIPRYQRLARNVSCGVRELVRMFRQCHRIQSESQQEKEHATAAERSIAKVTYLYSRCRLGIFHIDDHERCVSFGNVLGPQPIFGARKAEPAWECKNDREYCSVACIVHETFLIRVNWRGVSFPAMQWHDDGFPSRESP